MINDVIIYLRIFYFLGKNAVNQYYKNAHGAVDVLIGLDCADLHFSFKDVRGKPGQPVARLMPLGWTCIGAMEGQSQDNIRTNFVRTYFITSATDNANMNEVNMTLRRFWEIDNNGIDDVCRR